MNTMLHVYNLAHFHGKELWISKGAGPAHLRIIEY
jgi:hypothetical protein